MKNLYILILLLLTATAFSQQAPKKLIASCESRGCTGDAYCTACKNCSGCKHCAKEGGSCGVCAPAPAPKKQPVIKKTSVKKEKATKKKK